MTGPSRWWLVVYDDTTHTAHHVVGAVAADGHNRALHWIGLPEQSPRHAAATAVDELELERELAGWPVAVEVDRVIRVGNLTFGLLAANDSTDATDVERCVAEMAATAINSRRTV